MFVRKKEATLFSKRKEVQIGKIKNTFLIVNLFHQFVELVFSKNLDHDICYADPHSVVLNTLSFCIEMLGFKFIIHNNNKQLIVWKLLSSCTH